MKDIQLSENFKLSEMLASPIADANPSIKIQQQNPPDSVVANLIYVVTKAVQPSRTWLGCSQKITSGYRCLDLNRKVGSKDSSQHTLGEAIDSENSDSFLTDPKYKQKKDFLDSEIYRITGKVTRKNVNSNFYLFTYICLNLEVLDIDQVIHEFGAPGKPEWVHNAVSQRQSKRQILSISSTGTQVLTLKQALSLGV